MSNPFLNMTDDELLAEANRLIANFRESSLTFAQGSLSLTSRSLLVSSLIRASGSVQQSGDSPPPIAPPVSPPKKIARDPIKLQDVIRAPSMSPWNDPSEADALQNYLDEYEDRIRQLAVQNHGVTVVDIFPDPNRLATFRSNPEQYAGYPLTMWAKVRDKQKPDSTPTIEDEDEEPVLLNNVVVNEGIIVRSAEPRSTGWQMPEFVATEGMDWTNPRSLLQQPGDSRDRLASAYGAYLTLQDFGFRIPEGAAILGVEIEVDRSFFGSGNENLEEEVQLVQCRIDSAPADWVQVGAGLSDIVSSGGITRPALAALNTTDVAFADNGDQQLRTFRFTAGTWAQVGNSLAIPSLGFPAIARLSDTVVAIADNSLGLSAYEFDGTNWSKVGNTLFLPNPGSIAIAALNSTDIAFVGDGFVNERKLRVFRLSAGSWSEVGTALDLAGMGSPALAALNSTDVALLDRNSDQLRAFRRSGSTWSQVGSAFDVDNASFPALAAISATDVALIDSINDQLRTIRFSGDSWAQLGNSLAVPTGFPALASVGGFEVAFIDESNNELRKYEFV